MKANAVPLLTLFEKKMRFEVPLFQRQYVWSREQQWEPLWEDIERKFNEWLDGRKDAPVHFLGAMVLDQKQTPVTHVEKRHVIDGQQRLITLQIFLAALRDFCRENACEELAKELDGYTFNKGMMANPEVDKFKVWPTQLDRPQFTDVIGLGSGEAVQRKYPLRKQKYARHFDPRPRMVEAYLFFAAQLREFFLGTSTEAPFAAQHPLLVRVEETFQALKSALQVVAIDLEKDDDAQVIFETLNARGEPLLPADLLRNYIFLRAGRNGEPQEELYEKYWQRFDDEFWRQEVRQGRLIRPRSDLFMQHFLTSHQMAEVPIKHLYVEYRFWIEREKPFKSVADELAALANQRDDFRRIIEPRKDDAIYGLATFLENFDIRTAYPLLLFLMSRNLTGEQWSDISGLLESYLLRRAVLGWSTKAYNRIFLNLTKSLRAVGARPEIVKSFLSNLSGESSAWPTDEQFFGAWQGRDAYHDLNNAKLVHVLSRLNDTYLTSRNERVQIESPLTVEHLLPQAWLKNWPLQTGENGLSFRELLDSSSDDPRAVSTRRRDALVQTIGNLTILTQELNSDVSNATWAIKKPKLLASSLLPINQQLHAYDKWAEDTINQRSKELFQRATSVWPAPLAPPLPTNL